jgi:hypothetical protein
MAGLALVDSIGGLLRSLIPEPWLRRWTAGRSEQERQVAERQTAELATRTLNPDELKTLAYSLATDTILLIPRDASGRFAPGDFWDIGCAWSIFARWPGQLAYDEQFPVVGPPTFRSAVCRFLGELSERAPDRFHEALTHLPMAVYDPSVGGVHADGRADGRFAVEGGDYDRLRVAFLYEVGHNVSGKVGNDWSDDAADEYARAVLAELHERPSILPDSPAGEGGQR